MKQKLTALITGATSGIGEATAIEFAKHGIQLILCGRREERLNALKKLLANQTEVITLSFDVRDRQKTLDAIASLPANFSDIDLLINNAGNAHGLDPIENGNLDDWDAMMDINVKVLGGTLESSNVNPINEMTEMIALQRQFEMQLKMMKTAEEVDSSASSLLRAF